MLWDVTTLDRVRKCGRTRCSESGVGVRRSGDGAVGLAGLVTCGSVWACPCCNSKVMAARTVEVTDAIRAWGSQSARHGAAFGTFTMRHTANQGLRSLWESKSAAWRSVVSGSSWLADQERYGVEGWLAATEVTHGVNGWHVHLHVLLFVKDTDVDVDALQARMFGRWSAGLQRRGMAAPLQVGQDMHLVDGLGDTALGGYLTKATDDNHVAAQRVGLEMTQTQTKQERTIRGTRTPWAFLDGVAVGDADELDLWHEWERGSHGRRQMTWSKGFRDRLALAAVRDDEEIAEDSIGTEADTLLVIEPEGWRAVCAAPERIPAILDAAEGGFDPLRLLLDGWDVGWRPFGGIAIREAA